MPRAGLSGRLERMRTLRTEFPRTNLPTGPDWSPAALPGFERLGEFVFRRVTRIPVSPLPTNRSGLLLSAEIDPRAILFFDLETTGLSGGAGTVAFLAGFGRYDGSDLLLEQYFLSDYPGEAEFLRYLFAVLDEKSYLVSYNGRTFDAPLLTGRGRLKGFEYRVAGHLDLLYLSRRLWRSRIGSCSLGNIEAQVLDIHRTDDLPGAEVPERWFTFLRDGDSTPLSPVFAHHRQDILSLAILLSRLEGILRHPESAEGVDYRSLGVFLLKRGEPAGERLLEAGWREGDPAAGMLLALLHKRRGDWEQALRIWRQLAKDGPHERVCEELAKYYEHRRRRPEEALRWALRGQATLLKRQGPPGRLEACRRRITRLTAKCGET